MNLRQCSSILEARQTEGWRRTHTSTLKKSDPEETSVKQRNGTVFQAVTVSAQFKILLLFIQVLLLLMLLHSTHDVVANIQEISVT